MREFFRGWRRKIGVLTLVMACVYMVIAVISFALPISFFLSERGPHFKDEVGMSWGILVFGHVEEWNRQDLDDRDWEWHFLGFLCGVRHAGKLPDEKSAFLFIPCWPIILPLTSISALLLSKPRSKPPEST